MILNNLVSPSINCTRKAVNDPCSYFDNVTNGIESEAGYIVIETPTNSVGCDTSLVFD